MHNAWEQIYYTHIYVYIHIIYINVTVQSYTEDILAYVHYANSSQAQNMTALNTEFLLITRKSGYMANNALRLSRVLRFDTNIFFNIRS